MIFLAIFANFLAALLTRDSPGSGGCSAAAALLIAATLAIFFAWTFPANQATGNWTSVPENWEQLRTQWEYSHAANAAITFLALLCSVGGAVATRTRRETDARDSSDAGAAPQHVPAPQRNASRARPSSTKAAERIAVPDRSFYRRPMLE